MAPTELAAAVAVAEDIRWRWCDHCQTSDRYEAAIFAMLPSGLQKIGTLTGCERRDTSVIACHYCPATIDDGAAFWRHIRDHGEAADRG